MAYQVAVVGTGDPDQSDRFAMAYRHAKGYERLDSCELIGAADIVRENAVAFGDTFGIDEQNIYEDYESMLAELTPDIVSVCTPPKTHADIVTTCAQSRVRAIHCEKPMAGTWQECQEMVAVCDRQGVQLTFNHQRRFSRPYRKAKTLLDEGEIGELQRIEIGGPDLYDYGSHLFDLSGCLTDQAPVEWVLGQVDRSGHEKLYGLPQATESLVRWRYESGVDGFASTGEDGLVDCHLRAVGTDGVLEVGHEDGPPLRFKTEGSGWKTVDTGRDGIWRVQPHPIDRVLSRVPVGPDEYFTEPPYVSRGIEDIVTALQEGYEPALAAANALQTTEIIFAAWESARRGDRVDLPLEIEDNPLEAMIENKPRQPS